MQAGHRILEPPTAAVYLAEAEWRAGDQDAADRAADIALDAARQQGSNHVLLQALADFPAVVARRIDAEAHADSAWHGIGRALAAQGVPVPTQIPTAIELVEFGGTAIILDGEEVRPILAKCYEPLAFWPPATARRPAAMNCSTRCSTPATTSPRVPTRARRSSGYADRCPPTCSASPPTAGSRSAPMSCWPVNRYASNRNSPPRRWLQGRELSPPPNMRLHRWRAANTFPASVPA